MPNPFNPKQISKIELTPKTIDGIVFWTRNPAPMLGRLHILDEMHLPYYFLFTLNNYPKVFEPNLPPLESSMSSFHKLFNIIGKERLLWRYDPLILTGGLDEKFHINNFAGLCERLAGKTAKVITSVVSPYRKTLRRMKKAEPDFSVENADFELYIPILTNMKAAAKSAGMDLTVCCPGENFFRAGIKRAKCINEEIFNKEFGLELKYKKDKSQRRTCLCTESRDIGVNNTCPAGCRYCYAVISQKTAVKNFRKHDKNKESLI